MSRELVHPVIINALVMLITGLFGAGEAMAQDPVTVVVSPFDEEGTAARDLSAAIELELEFEEELLLKPWKPIIDEVGTEKVGDVSTATLGRAMRRLKIRAVVRAEVDEEYDDVLVLYLHRAPEGEVVFVLPVRVDDAVKDPRKFAVNPLSTALRDLELLSPLSEREIRKEVADFVGVDLPEEKSGRVPLGSEPEQSPDEPEDGPKNGEPDDAPEGGEPDDAPEDGEPDDDPEPGASPDEGTDDEDIPAPFAKLVRVAAYYSPAFVYYRACQPGTVDILGQCDSAATSPNPTEASLPMLGTAAVFAESFALPFVGFAGGASASFTQITSNNGSIEPFTSAQINVDAAVIPNYTMRFDDIGLRLGARLGYGLSLGVTEDHRGQAGVTILPSHNTHALLAGIRLATGMPNSFEASLDLDAIPFAVHGESPDVVGTANFAYGARGRLNVDILLFSGLRVGVFVEGNALRAVTSGEGSRLTRSLVLFNGGDVFLASVRAGVGVGFGL